MVDEGLRTPDGSPSWFYFPDGHFQEFMLRNNGDVTHTVRFGVWYQYPEDIQRGLLFIINGVAVQQQFGTEENLLPIVKKLFNNSGK